MIPEWSLYIIVFLMKTENQKWKTDYDIDSCYNNYSFRLLTAIVNPLILGKYLKKLLVTY